MTAEFISYMHLRFAILLVVIALVSCVSAISTDFRMDVNSPRLHHVSGINLNDAHAKRNLRIRMLTATDENDDSSDERVINLRVPSVTKFKDLVSSATQKLEKLAENAKLKKAAKNQKDTDKSYRTFEVDKVESNVLESAQFQNWLRFVYEVYKMNFKKGRMAMVTTLTEHYDDEGLAILLNKAKAVSNTKIIAGKLEVAQLTKWHDDEHSVSDVFKLLNLDKAKKNVFESPVLSSWVTYSNMFEKNDKQVLFLTLKTHFDDETLAKMLIAAKTDSNVATKLEKVELENWLNSGKTIDAVFKLLNLNDETGNILKNPAFDTWVSYVTMMEKGYPYDIVLAKLLTRYDDQSLAKLIVADYGSPIIATRLEAALLKTWAGDTKSPHDVFKLLSLHKEKGVDLLKSDMLRPWISYVEMLKKNPNELLLKELKIYNNDGELVNMLVMAKENNRSKYIAGLLELLQKNWIDEGKTADEVFDTLKLGKEGDSVFNSPVWSTWTSYLTRVNEQNPDKPMYLVLKTQFGEEKLRAMISKAKENPRTKTIADKLQEEAWLDEGKTADEVFDTLKLGKEGDSVFNSPVWSTWTSYLTRVNEQNPDEPMYLVLKTQFGEEKLRAMISKAKENPRTKTIADKLQEEAWRSEGKTADDIFKVLKLDEKGDKLFESSMLSTWVSYVTKLEKLKEKPDGFAVISYLEKRFDSVDLACMLSKEKIRSNEATKKVVIELQELQFKQWKTERMNPWTVARTLAAKKDTVSLSVTVDYFAFYRANR